MDAVRRAATSLPALLLLSTVVAGAPASADHTPAPSVVTVAGSFQSELGCPGDWQPDCAVTDLALDPTDGVWQASFDLPAGSWEYKAALGGTWDENYGAGAAQNGPNIAFTLDAPTSVVFLYDHATHWIASSADATIATVAGSFQSELGCPGDWQPDCLRSWLQDPDGDGLYRFVTTAIPPGSYELKVALDQAWDVSYPASNVAFDVPAAGRAVTVVYDRATNAVTVEVAGGITPGDEALVRPSVRNETDEVFYFMLPDRFENGDPANDTGGIAGGRLDHGHDPTDEFFYHGGDLAGVVSRLDYLEQLGATAVWVSPIQLNQPVQHLETSPSAGYHGYWIRDFLSVDPHLGTEADLRTLIAEAHARDIEVFLDVIVNHTADIITYEEGTEPPYISKADEPYRTASGDPFDDRDHVGGPFPPLDPDVSFPYTPTFRRPEDATIKNPAWLNDVTMYHNRGNSTFRGENSRYGDFVGLDDLFTERGEVVDGMVDVFSYWITEYGVDGFRIDTVKHVNREFWEVWGPAIEQAAADAGIADFFQFGEVFSGDPAFTSRFVRDVPLPAVLDFPMQGAATTFAANSAAPSGLRDLFAADDWYVDADSNAYSLPTFVSNHDIGRLGLAVRNANAGATDTELVARHGLAHTLLFTARGMPVVYAGDEQGFVGDGGDTGARQDLFPSQVPSYNDDDLIGTDATTADANFDTTHPLYEHIASLAALRQAHPALQRGAQLQRHADTSAGILAYSRIDRDERVEYLVVLNNAEEPRTATIPTSSPDTTFTPLWPAGGASTTSDGSSQVEVTVGPLAATVLRADAPLPPSAAAPGITLAPPAEVVQRHPDVETDQVGLWLAASLDDPHRYAEVTFAAAVDGGEWQVIGTDDNAPYQAFLDTATLAPGTPIAVKAIVDDLEGNLAAAAATATAPDPTAGGGDAPGFAVVHYVRDDADPIDDWGLWVWEDVDPSLTDGREWPDMLEWNGDDGYGVFRYLPLVADADRVGFIVAKDVGTPGAGTKDVDADRFFDPRETPEVWLRQGDPTVYATRAAAQGYVEIRWQNPTGDYDGWGLHLWGDVLAPGAGTDWTAPRPPDEIDAFGARWQVPIDRANVEGDLNFIVHRGDEKRIPPDESLVPADTPEAWLIGDDPTVHPTRGAALDLAVLHYHRDDGDYGDPSSGDFNDFWGLHVWTGAATPTSWTDPVRPVGQDRFGLVFEVPLVDGADELAYIIHRGDQKDPGPDQFLDLGTFGHEVWQLSGREDYLLPILSDARFVGDLGEARAHWVAERSIAWDVEAGSSRSFAMHVAPDGGLDVVDGAVVGGEAIPLTLVSPDLPPDLAGRFPHLASFALLEVPADVDVPAALRGQVAVSRTDDGVLADATGLQLPGVLDDLYATDVPLGVTWDGDVPTISVWAPTARSVRLHLFDDGQAPPPGTVVDLVRDDTTGVWSATGAPDWDRRFYLFEVEVFAPSTGQVETNLVTDPYATSLATNSAKSQIVDLDDPDLAPDGWDDVATVGPHRPERLGIYELHVRDFSISDETVPADLRGTYRAFTVEDSDGMRHLRDLSDAGLTSVHLLPVFDIATIEERRDHQLEPDPSPEASLDDWPSDSEVPQERVAAVADDDGFNWGYDPFHYTTPEGSYATDPEGTPRIREFREMVAALNGTDLGVVMDVVYNHTTASGQDEKSVLDRIVPGYYHRLLEDGSMATSTCCQNTATEHAMMERLMIDSVVTWARDYKVDGFRFDLMGHHSKQSMLAVRAALDGLELAADGVDGRRIALYGEGWNFGEVADDARFEQATQANLAGTGIGTFNDRLRDAVRGGGPFDADPRIQGFASGLYTDPNGAPANGDTAQQLEKLLLEQDRIRVGLAGNLRDYRFVDRTGTEVTGADVDYNGSPVGYTADPQENVVYVSAHDNETLYDALAYKLPAATPMAQRVRAQLVALSTVALAQGIDFFHAGSELLRSKSLDRNSYNSGDHFNELDWAFGGNNFGVGLPPAGENASKWPFMRPLLADPALAAGPDAIGDAAARFGDLLQIGRSSPLFALETAGAVQDKVGFLNTGPDQQPGLIVMQLDDTAGEDIDAALERIVVLFNAAPAEATFTETGLAGHHLSLHPIQLAGADPVVRSATFDPSSGTFTVPGRTTAVFVESATVPVDLDVRPGSETNPVNPRSRGVLPFGLRTTDAIDVVHELDRSSLTFGATGDEDSVRFCMPFHLDRDGRRDLLCLAWIPRLGIQEDTDALVVRGYTHAGQPVEGRDVITIVGR